MRLDAVPRLEAGATDRAVATALRVSERSVERWRRQWREGGAAGVVSEGSPGRPRLSDKQITRLERELSAARSHMAGLTSDGFSGASRT